MKEKLVSLAKEARKQAYAPYSKYYVGAALLCEDGSIFTGCNIENVSYGLTNCAERTAFFKAISEGHRRFVAIAICGGGEEEDICPPCGACRQVMREFCDDSFTVYLCGAEKTEDYTLNQLMPMSFTKDTIG